MDSPSRRRYYLPFWPALVVLLACLLLPGYWLATLEFDNAPEVYLPHDAPSVAFERELRKAFPSYELEVVLLKGEDVFSDRVLDAVDVAVAKLEALPDVARVFSPTHMDHIAGTADGFSVEPLLGARERHGLSIEQRRQRALADRFAPGLVVSRDGQAIALIVRPKPLDDSVERERLDATIRQILVESGLQSHTAAVAGQLPLDVAQFHSMLRDNAIFIPATILVGLLLVWLLFRRLLAVALSLVTISAVTQPTLMLLVLWHKPFTLVTSILPPFLSALTVASLVHFYNALAHAAARGLDGRARIHAALDEVARPSWYAIVTTIAGLLSLSTSTIQPIRQFGIVGGIGMLLLYLMVIHVLPGLVERWDRRGWPLHENTSGGMQRMVDIATHLGIRRAGWVALAFLVVTVAGLPLLSRVKAETNLYKFFSEEHPINRATHAVESALSGVMPLDIVLQAPARDGLLQPDRLKFLAELKQYAESLPEVDRSLSMVDILEEMNWAFHGEDPAYRKLPEDRKLISQYLLIYDGKDLYELSNRDFNTTRLSLSLNVHDTASLRRVMAILQRHLDGLDRHGLTWSFASEARIFTEQERLLIDGQINGIWGSVLTIFLFMLVMCRNLVAALITMVVNVTPILLVFVLMGALRIPLDMATALIACIAVGIAIDDTVHTYVNASGHLARGAGITRAVAKTYREAGRAVTITTIILVSQFLILIGSEFIPTREFGFLTGTGLAVAFGFDLLLMPSLLVLRWRWQHRQS